MYAQIASHVCLPLFNLQISAIKNELAAISAGKVLVDVELLMCSRQELNPVVLAITDDGRLINKPLDVSAVPQHTGTCVWQAGRQAMLHDWPPPD
jgi:hypothetical protein